MKSTRPQLDPHWWLKKRRRLPWPAIYVGVVAVTLLAQFGGYQLAGALSPDQWSYRLPNERPFALNPDPYSTVLFAPVDARVIDDAVKSGEVLGPPLAEPRPTPLPTHVNHPSSLVPSPSPTFTRSPSPQRQLSTFTMSAPASASPNSSFMYRIDIGAVGDFRGVVVRTHLPKGLTSSEANCNQASDSEGHVCYWYFESLSNTLETIKFQVNVDASVGTDLKNHAHAEALGFPRATSNEVTVGVK